MRHQVKAVNLGIPKDHHTDENSRCEDLESLERARKNRAAMPRILLRLFPYDHKSQLEFESPLLIDNKFFFRHFHVKQTPAGSNTAHTGGLATKGSDGSLLTTENLKIMEIIHYAEESTHT